MQSRIAIIGIIVEEPQYVDQLNQVLHEYRQYIVGRMGIPYQKRGVSIISVAMDAPQDKINARPESWARSRGSAPRPPILSWCTRNEGAD